MKENQNEELQSRREFFKKAAKAALPVVGAVVMASLPQIMLSASTGCDHGCLSSCYGACYGCGTQCSTQACATSCYSTCSGKCNVGCMSCAY